MLLTIFWDLSVFLKDCVTYSLFLVCDVNSCNQQEKGTYHLHLIEILNLDLFFLCISLNAHKGQFYRIHVGIQSPEGFSSSHGILRRFSDFLKLCSDVS